MALKTYDFNSVLVLWGGVELSGFADGESVSITPNADRYSHRVGNDGEPVRSRVNDDTYEVTLRLQAVSPSNAVLLASHALDAAGNSGVVPMAVIDTNGAEIFAASSAYVKRLPNMAFAREDGTREWVISTGKADLAVGGYVS